MTGYINHFLNGLLEKSLNIVVTRGNHNDIAKFKKNVRAILAARRKELTPWEIKVIEIIASDKNGQITFLNRPSKTGRLKYDKSTITNKAEYVEDLRISISLSPQAKDLVKETAKNITTEIETHLRSFEISLPKHVEQFVRSQESEAQGLRESMESMAVSLGETCAQPQKGQSVQEEYTEYGRHEEIVVDVIGKLDSSLKQKISNLIEYRSLLRRISSDHFSSTLNKGGVMRGISVSLENYASPPIFTLNGGTTNIDGEIIGTSDVMQVVPNGYVRMDVLAKHSLIVDSKVTMPGVNLILYAPLWVIRGQKEISLRGKDASKEYITQGAAGQDGTPGEPGQSGGNFYGIATEIHNPAGLTIDVRGGKGGLGQSGGNGKRGEDGKRGCKDDIEKRRESAVTRRETVKRGAWKWAFTGYDATRIFLSSGTEGEVGGHAGRGGRGGFGGKSGLIKLDQFGRNDFWRLSLQDKMKLRLDDGADGTNGEAGEAGRGGTNLPVYKGVYIEKERNAGGLFKRMIADGGAGAGTGAAIGAWGGPFTAAAGAIGGAIVGALTPVIGSENR